MTEMNFVNENISPVDELQQIITDNVEWLRRRRKITQTDLAVDMHISQPNLSKKIRGSIAWTLPDIALLADYFRVPVSYLVTDNIVAPVYQGRHDVEPDNAEYQVRHNADPDSVRPELAGATGTRYLVRPNDNSDENGKKKGRGGSPRARAIVMARDDWMVPSVGLEPTLRRF